MILTGEEITANQALSDEKNKEIKSLNLHVSADAVRFSTHTHTKLTGTLFPVVLKTKSAIKKHIFSGTEEHNK